MKLRRSGVGGIDGHVGAACFEDAHEGDDHFEAAFHADADHAVWLDALCDEEVGQLVGCLVELLVA